MNFASLITSGVSRAVLAASLLVFALAGTVAPSHAQGQTGTIIGFVVDSAGKALGGARITITSGVGSTSLVSAPDGSFTAHLTADTYTVTAAESGFQTAQQEGVTVLPGLSATVKLTLANATLQTIGTTVTSRATSLNTSAAATQSVSSQTFVDQGQAQVVNVLDQIPGVDIDRSNSNEPGAGSSVSIRGAQPYESQVLIDGHPVVTSANGVFGFNSSFVNSLLIGDVDVNEGPGSLPNTIEDAIGGTLNFRTPGITAGPSGSALVGYDSFNGNYYSIKASDTFGKLGVLVGLANYETPGYLTPQNLYGGALYPKVTAGTAYNPHVGVVDFAYHATSNFSSFSQIAKLSYSFSPQTSLLLTQYSTQSSVDETGTNDQFAYATILPCIQKVTGGATSPACTPGGSGQNYTSIANEGLIGQVVPINAYAPYPSTGEFDNEPIYSAEFRTTIGPGSLLARYYTGVFDRVVTQSFAPYAVDPCSSPACPNGDTFINGMKPSYNSDNYDGEPYIEDTFDVLHGLDGQYTVPFGNNSVTAGFDRHVDSASFGSYDPTTSPLTFSTIPIQSLAYSLRGMFAITPKLTLDSGNYLSDTSYVGTRFDPRDGLVYRVSPKVVLRVSYGSAYAAPYYDLLNPSSYVSSGTLHLATTNFKPETSSGYDLGGDVKLGRDTIFKADAYLTNIFNRYASVSSQMTGSFDGKPYTMISQNGNQAVVRNEGLEVQLLRAPRIGLGYHGTLDLLRDYAYDQASTGVSVMSIYNDIPGNYVQLPTYPYLKLRNDLFYSFGGGSQARLSATSYGENNAFGEPGFTEFDGEIRLPLKLGLILNVGGTNLFNHDDYQAGGIYDGGPTFQVIGGGITYTTRYFVQPRTLYLQLQRSIGPAGTIEPSRTSL